MPTFTQGHALVIGIGEYDYLEQRHQTPVAVTDAQGVAAALRDQNVCAYPSNQVTLLPTPDTTCAGVKQALNDLAGRVDWDDTVLIFFCGHGGPADNGVYTFATRDVRLEDETHFKSGTGLSQPDLMNLLRAIRDKNVKKLLFIMNACFSGNVAPALGPGEPAEPPALGALPDAQVNEVLAQGGGNAIITASRAQQKSWYDRSGQPSFFARALIDGLRGNGLTTNSAYVGLFELYEFIYHRVKKASQDAYGATQEPVLTLLQGVGPFPVAHYRGGTGGSLSLGDLQQSPPQGTAFQPAKQIVVNVQGQDNVGIGEMFDFGGARINGGVHIDHVAGRDQTNIENPSSTDSEKEKLLKTIAQLREQVAQLQGAPQADIEDAQDALARAGQAGQEGNKDRLIQKLDAAQKIIVAVSAAVPGAIQIAQALGAALLKAKGLWGG